MNTTVTDCRQCKLPPFPGEELAEGLCLECWDLDAGKHYRSPGASASQRLRDRLRHSNSGQAKITKRAYIERRAAEAGKPVPAHRPWQYKQAEGVEDAINSRRNQVG